MKFPVLIFDSNMRDLIARKYADCSDLKLLSRKMFDLSDMRENVGNPVSCSDFMYTILDSANSNGSETALKASYGFVVLNFISWV